MVMTRRSAIAGALAAPFALATAGAAATPSATGMTIGTALTDADAWVRLCAERRLLHQLAEDSAIGGNIPDDVADLCWSRVAEIDADIASSKPATERGLRAALVEYLIELEGCGICDEALLQSLLGAALAFVEGSRQ